MFGFSAGCPILTSQEQKVFPMSQSIYGVRLPGTIGDVISQLDGMRPLMRIKAQEHIAHAIAHIAVQELDRDIVFKTGSGRNYLSEAYTEMRRRRKKVEQNQERDPLVDTSFEIVLRSEGPFVVMISFTEHQEWYGELLALPGAEDYSYWDGSDRPETVSEEDWADRGRTYRRILSNDPHGRPAGIGVTHSFLPPSGAPDIELILTSAPGKEERCRRMARELTYTRWLDSRDTDQVSVSDHMRFMSDLEKPEMQEELRQLEEDVAKKLPEITRDILMHGPDMQSKQDAQADNQTPGV